MTYSIRKLNLNDWEALRRIRLEALTLHPNFFAPSRDEFKFTEADWKERVSSADSANFGLYDENNNLIGLTGVTRDKNDRTRAWLVASYIQKPFRRSGLTKLLYEARIQWALEQNDIRTLVIHHRIDNEPSRKSHQKFGFEFIKEYPPEKWPNGDVVAYVEYIKKI